MRILYLSTSLIYGGAEKLLVSYANLQAPEHEVHLVYFKDEPKLLPTVDKKIKIYHVKLSLGVVFELRRLIKNINPEVVHSHLGHADLIGMLACSRFRMKYYLTLHNIFFKKNWQDEVYYLAYRFLLNFAVPQAKTISVSNAIKTKLSIAKLKLSDERSLVRYNGIRRITINESSSQLRSKLSIPQTAFVILFIGRMVPQKSVHTLIEAMAMVSDEKTNVKCILLGEGALKEELMSLSAKLKLNDVIEFRGVSSEPELYYPASDVFVLPSIFEGLVTVAIESFRAGLPIIGTRIDGNTELIEDNKNGLFFETGNVEELATKILYLIENKAILESLKIGAFQSYEKGFDLELYNSWLLNEYKS